MELNEQIESFLELRVSEGTLRSLSPVSGKMGSRITINGKELVDFTSNDYLGLSAHPEMLSSAVRGQEKFGAGSGGSRLLGGDNMLFRELEDKLNGFKGKPASLVFNSGYQCNIGVISTLFSEKDVIFADKLSHASILDGIKLSGARLFRFRHNDTDHLKEIIQKERNKYDNCAIITESVFSMDGDIAPLKQLCEIKNEFNALFFVDEAHATGLFGDNGSGMVRELGVTAEVDVIMGTFSKALGSFGAYISTTNKIREYLVNSCRSFIYSTSLPPGVIAANIKAIELVSSEKDRRDRIRELSRHFRSLLMSAGIKTPSMTQIIPVITGSNEKAVRLSGKLMDRGYYVKPVRYPTVAKGDARLRFSLNYGHSNKDIESAVKILTSE